MAVMQRPSLEVEAEVRLLLVATQLLTLVAQVAPGLHLQSVVYQLPMQGVAVVGELLHQQQEGLVEAEMLLLVQILELLEL